MNIEVEIWSTKKDKNGKPFSRIETVHNIDGDDIESSALEAYMERYDASFDTEYKARISKTIIN